MRQSAAGGGACCLGRVRPAHPGHLMHGQGAFRFPSSAMAQCIFATFNPTNKHPLPCDNPQREGVRVVWVECAPRTRAVSCAGWALSDSLHRPWHNAYYRQRQSATSKPSPGQPSTPGGGRHLRRVSHARPVHLMHGHSAEHVILPHPIPQTSAPLPCDNPQREGVPPSVSDQLSLPPRA